MQPLKLTVNYYYMQEEEATFPLSLAVAEEGEGVALATASQEEAVRERGQHGGGRAERGGAPEEEDGVAQAAPE